MIRIYTIQIVTFPRQTTHNVNNNTFKVQETNIKLHIQIQSLKNNIYIMLMYCIQNERYSHCWFIIYHIYIALFSYI